MSISYYSFHSTGLISNITLFDWQINSLNASEAKKIRLKVVLALNHVNKDLYDQLSFDVSLEMMPCLLEMLQQSIGYDGFGKDIVPKSMPDMSAPQHPYSRYNRRTQTMETVTTDGRWNPLTKQMEKKTERDNEMLSRVYDTIRSSHCLPLLFARGPGELKESNQKDKASKSKLAKKKKTKPRKRRRFGDESDDEDEPFIPRGARTTGYSQYNQETMKWEHIPPPAEFY
jgi:hypothetical protein